jgi:hypothetical protein
MPAAQNKQFGPAFGHPDPYLDEHAGETRSVSERGKAPRGSESIAPGSSYETLSNRTGHAEHTQSQSSFMPMTFNHGTLRRSGSEATWSGEYGAHQPRNEFDGASTAQQNQVRSIRVMQPVPQLPVFDATHEAARRNDAASSGTIDHAAYTEPAQSMDHLDLSTYLTPDGTLDSGMAFSGEHASWWDVTQRQVAPQADTRLDAGPHQTIEHRFEGAWQSGVLSGGDLYDDTAAHQHGGAFENAARGRDRMQRAFHEQLDQPAEAQQRSQGPAHGPPFGWPQ